ncbi:hypothetical protein ACWGNZ_07115 [Sphingomonas zeae]
MFVRKSTYEAKCLEAQTLAAISDVLATSLNQAVVERDQAVADMKAADEMALSLIQQHEATIADLTAQVAALEADRPQRGEGGRYKKREG